MSESWYKKSMPQIKDFKPVLSEISSNLKKINGVDKLFVWGSFVANQSNPNYRIKDLDILAKTKFHSEDLVAINKDTIKNANKIELLEEDGFYSPAVKFSNDFLSYNKYRIDHWALSKDNKLLHWGPCFSTKEEADEITKDAEEYTTEKTGIDRNRLNKASNETCKNWYKTYNHFMSYYFDEMPSGWYQSENANIKTIISESLEI